MEEKVKINFEMPKTIYAKLQYMSDVDNISINKWFCKTVVDMFNAYVEGESRYNFDELWGEQGENI